MRPTTTTTNMADDVIDFDGLRLSFDNHSDCSGSFNGTNDGHRRFYVGQVLLMQISLPLTSIGHKKLKTTHPEKSPIAQNLFIAFMRQLSTTVEVKYSFKPFGEGSLKKQTKNDCQWMDCILVSSIQETLGYTEDLKGQPFLSKDRSFYHIPLQVRIPDTQSQCNIVQLEVQARSVNRHAPCWLSSPTRNESGSIYQQQEPNVGTSNGKTVSLPLRIIHPPKLKFQQKSVAGKHMIFLQIKNTSAYYCIKIDECVVLPESCPKSTKNLTCTDCRRQHTHKMSGCSPHSNLVKMVRGGTEMVDNLSPSECYTLCYVLNTTDGIENLSKEDLSLEVHIKWSIPYQQYNDHSTVLTTYRLPAMRVKQAPFVMCASVEGCTVKRGDSFTILYSITNRLQDFLSITLNWNPNLADERDIKGSHGRTFQDGLVCQDPCIELGPCLYGSTLQAKVTFQAVTSGVYEVCRHMKINLRYLIPSSETVSLGSPCSQTSDDLLCVAAEDLWRSRSGSGSSFNDAKNSSEFDNKFSLAYKSYSSGDLGPDVPVFECDSNAKQRNHIEDKLSLQKLDVPHSSKFEQLLLSPSNFLKSSCQVYVQ